MEGWGVVGEGGEGVNGGEEEWGDLMIEVGAVVSFGSSSFVVWRIWGCDTKWVLMPFLFVSSPQAKDKEQAVLMLYRIYNLHPVKWENLRPESAPKPFVRSAERQAVIDAREGYAEGAAESVDGVGEDGDGEGVGVGEIVDEDGEPIVRQGRRTRSVSGGKGKKKVEEGGDAVPAETLGKKRRRSATTTTTPSKLATASSSERTPKRKPSTTSPKPKTKTKKQKKAELVAMLNQEDVPEPVEGVGVGTGSNGDGEEGGADEEGEEEGDPREDERPEIVRAATEEVEGVCCVET